MHVQLIHVCILVHLAKLNISVKVIIKPPFIIPTSRAGNIKLLTVTMVTALIIINGYHDVLISEAMWK